MCQPSAITRPTMATATSAEIVTTGFGRLDAPQLAHDRAK
jgi:hypothetical protein